MATIQETEYPLNLAFLLLKVTEEGKKDKNNEKNYVDVRTIKHKVRFYCKIKFFFLQKIIFLEYIVNKTKQKRLEKLNQIIKTQKSRSTKKSVKKLTIFCNLFNCSEHWLLPGSSLALSFTLSRKIILSFPVF